jgi:hypothetical protein
MAKKTVFCIRREGSVYEENPQPPLLEERWYERVVEMSTSCIPKNFIEIIFLYIVVCKY